MRKLLLLILCILTVSCGSITAKYKDAYKSSQSLPPLKIPPDLNAPPTKDTWTVPELRLDEGATLSIFQDGIQFIGIGLSNKGMPPVYTASDADPGRNYPG